MVERTFIRLDDIVIPKKARPVDRNTVDSIAKSIQSIGLINAIKIYRKDDKTFLLVSGHHRIEAYRKLGRQEIECLYISGDEITRELIEISDNLHRAKLTVQERSEKIARWSRLTRIKMAQLAPVSLRGGRGKRGGARTVAVELGLSRDQVDRSEKIAALTNEAKEASRELGLDDNQSALLAACRMHPSKQEAEIRRQAAKRDNLNSISTDKEVRLRLIDEFRQKLRCLLNARPCNECLDVVDEEVRKLRSQFAS